MEWIDLNSSQLNQIDALIRADNKIGAIKALRDFFRTLGTAENGWNGYTTLGLKEAKEAVEHRMGTCQSPTVKIRPSGIRVIAVTLDSPAGLIQINEKGGVRLPESTISVEDMRQIVSIWDSFRG
jgi:hypothetical protein